MAGGVIYNGKSIVPAPFVSIDKTYDEAQDGTILGSTFSITLDGKFLPYKGSPTSSGTLWPSGVTYADETVNSDSYLTAMLRKQEAIRGLFSQQGKLFTIQGYDGSHPLTCNPRIKNIRLPKGGPTSWANLSDYTVTLEADIIYVGGSGIIEDSGNPANYKISSAENSWNIETLDENLQTYRLTHQLSAKGKRTYSSSGTLDYLPWENARTYVMSGIGLGIKLERLWATGVLNDTGLSGYNYVRTQQVNELGGTFSVSETWLAYNASGMTPATEEYSCDIRQDMAGVVQVGIKGEVKGLEVRNGSTRQLISSKYTNALSKFLSSSNFFYSRATGIADAILHPTPLNKTVGHNTIAGTISYNYEYDNRPTAVISGALSESISINFQYPQDIFAEIGVLGRAAGPVLQSIQTIGSKKKSVTVEAILPAKTQVVTPTMPDTNSFISGLAPSATQVLKNQDTVQWDENKGRFSRSTSWTYQ